MNEKIEKKGLLDRMLDSIERAGNRLPDPITMFLGLAIIVAVISAICSAAGINAVNPADGLPLRSSIFCPLTVSVICGPMLSPTLLVSHLLEWYW